MPLIYYLVTRQHQYTMNTFLKEWAPQLRQKLEIVPYDAIRGLEPRAGTYIFSDLERLRGLTLRAVCALWDRISGNPGSKQLNDPHGRHFRRLSALRLLSERQVNPYDAYPLLRGLVRARLPAFLRSEGEHRLVSRLLHTRPALGKAALRAIARSGVLALKEGAPPRRQLVVEFHDTRTIPEERFAKYSAFMVGGRVIPRHLIVGPDWYLKTPTDLGEEVMEAEWSYLLENPHEDWIRKVFSLVELDYGRIDYSIGSHGAVVWEINTNPMVLLPRHRYQVSHLKHQEWFLQQILDSFERIQRDHP